MVALFNRYEMKMQNCDQRSLSVFGVFRTRNVTRKKIDWQPPPSPSNVDYLHGETFRYKSYGSLWQLLVKCEKGQFFRKLWDVLWLPYQVLLCMLYMFILKCLKMPRNQDSVSRVCKFKNPLKIRSHIWAPPDSQILDKKKLSFANLVCRLIFGGFREITVIISLYDNNSVIFDF